MPPRDPNLRLQDIAEAIDRIFDYTASHSLESFAADRMAVDAVVRNFEVIGGDCRPSWVTSILPFFRVPTGSF